MSNGEYPIDPLSFLRPPELTEADFVVPPERQSLSEQHRTQREATIAAVAAGIAIQTPQEARDWLVGLRDNTLWGARWGAIEHQTIRDIYANLSVVQERSPDAALGAEVAAYVNEMKESPRGLPHMQSSFVLGLLLVALRQRGMQSSADYQLLHHGNEMPPAETPLHQFLDDFLTHHVEFVQRPSINRVLPTMLSPITPQNRPAFRAVAHIAAAQAEDPHGPAVKEPTKLIQTATTTVMNLLEYIDAQADGSTNAAVIMDKVRSRQAKSPYPRIEARGVAAATPFTAFIEVANLLSRVLEGVPPLDETNIRDLPRAIDRLLHIATAMGSIASKIDADPEFRGTVADVRGAVDEVIPLGVTRKLGPVPLTMQEAVLALGTYMPVEDIPTAVQRLEENTYARAGSGTGAHRRQHHLLQQWKAAKMKAPGHGMIS